MGDRRALIPRDVGDAGLQKRFGHGENSFTPKFLAPLGEKFLHFLFEYTFRHCYHPSSLGRLRRERNLASLATGPRTLAPNRPDIKLNQSECSPYRFLIHQRQPPTWTARSIYDLKLGRDQNRSFCGKLVQIRQAREPELAAPVHDAVARKRRIETEGLPRIGTDAFRSPSNHISLFRKKGNQIGMGAGHVRTVFFYIQKGGGLLPFRPVRAHQNPGPSFDAPMLTLPDLDVLLSKKEVGINDNRARRIDHTRGRKETFGWNSIRRILRKLLACDPMDGRVKMRAGVLAAGKIVPIPGRTPRIIF